MRILILSDLHITPDSNYISTPWVEHFCNFMKNRYFADTLVIVLGDIIQNDGKNGEIAFKAASKIFDYIKSQLSSVDYKIVFIPGNHDYCNGNLNAFEQFCRTHQTFSEPFLFSQKTTFHFSLEDFNFILTNSIRDNNYKIAGQLDLAAICAGILKDKENILFMHHSLLFEDSSDHTGVIKQTEAITFLEQNLIEFVFHGHTHAMSNFNNTNKKLNVFGVGSIGVENPGLDNEKEQFFEVQINGNRVEAVANWLWRGGTKSYANNILYPNSSKKYDNGDLIPRILYDEPENYIKRYILSHNIAEDDEMARHFALDKKTTLFYACSKKKLVLFIADAGLGKTMEMKHLAYAISMNNPYMRPVFLSLNYYNGQSIEGYLNDYLDAHVPQYKTLDPNQFILIMDGYDEMTEPKSFEKALLQYIEKYPKTHICISMRSNFLSSNFSEFSVYQLLELSNLDVQKELQRHDINKSLFFEECNRKNLLKIIQNPFYLSKLIEIYISDHSLPNQPELIDRFIEIQFENDAKKFKYSKSLKENRYEFERALTRFAYGMQLLGCSSCNEKTYQSIIEPADRQYIKYSSLTINTSAGNGFEHSIFKEYLVAKYVSQMSSADIINLISIPGTKYLNPNWFNILGFILQLNPCKELEAWVQEVEPLALTKLEPDRISSNLRYAILNATLSDIVFKNVWFRNEICSEAQFAAFVQSLKAVNLLIGHIETPNHFRSLYFCLSVLLHFSNLYGADDKVRQVLVNCYQSPDVRPHEKRVAISAIAVLKLNTPEITLDLINRFAESHSSYERLGVYEYLKHSNQCDTNIEFLLLGIKFLTYSFQNKETTNVTEHFTLMECFNSISEPTAIQKSITWYSHKEHMDQNFYNQEKIFSVLFDKASIAYNSGFDSLFETVYTFFINATHRYHHCNIPDALKFFSTTNTIEAAFVRLVSEDAEERLLTIEDMIQFQPELIDAFYRLYMEDKLDQEIFRWYVVRHPENSLFDKCAEAIRIKTGEILTPKLPRDYNLQRRKNMQSFFNCLFDPDAMQTLLIQLTDFYGNREITFEQLRKSRMWRECYPEGTEMLESTLVQSEFKEERIIDFIDLIDWNCFFIDRICYLFHSENAVSFLIINEKQLEVLTAFCQELEENLDYHTAVEEPDLDSSRISLQMYDYMILKEALNLKSPNRYYLGLLEIPCGFVNQQSNVGEKYDVIEKYISKDTIAAQIEVLAPQETRICVLEDLMFGCTRYRIRSCKEVAVRMCKMSEVSAYRRRNALEYLLEVFDSELILNEIMPISDNELFEIIVNIIRETEDERLKAEMVKRYNEEPNRFLLKNLIVLNVQEGLQFYIDASRTNNSICDYSDGIGEVTDAISSIYDINLLPLLLEAVRMRFSGSFQDGSFHTLYNSLQNAFLACAKTNYDLVRKSINSLKEEFSQNIEAINFCSVLQDNMIQNNKMSLIKKRSISEIQEILRHVN